MQIASLNINGFGNLVRDHPDNKWGRVYRMMSDQRIGILLVQEAHLTCERKAAIHRMFARKLKIFHSEHPDAPTQREGVAIVLNARYTNVSSATAIEVVPGRAIQVTLTCQGGDTRSILCIYAPTSNGVEERKTFFKEVRKFYEGHPEHPKPHLMAGDFNNVEDNLDRLPIGEGPDQSILALDELKLSLGLMLADGWRTTYPNHREYTFQRGSGLEAVFSRLDRIYITPAIFEGAREWRICESGVKTDHSLILVQLTSENAPIVGAGRPIFPLQLLRDKKLAKIMKLRGLEACSELDRLTTGSVRTEDTNPQVILSKLKSDLMKLARSREREVVPRLLAEIREIERALKCVKARKDTPEHERLAEAAALTKQVRQLKQLRYKQQQQNSRATHRLFGDRPTKYWSKLHRETAPRDIIPSFKKEGSVGAAGEKVYELDSVKMAEMACQHHMNVQRDEPDSRPPEQRELDITIALDSLDLRLDEQQADDMGGEITYDECTRALRVAKNGTAPGIDGIPFELWKTLHTRYTEDSRFPERKAFNIVRLLTAAYEDARIHGVSARTSFAHGWIAPIYKEKGERTKVVNYRPITLLNTDYKLLSKTLAVRLAVVAPEIINSAQAGFVPGRKISNHTQLARLMMTWAEANDEDGAIVALDQEKAYDKVAHDYLWRVLERFGVPATVIQLIRSLYGNATTSIMINGILSKPYRIYRGVRQGDPLSCLLFDLAIEPLSAMIRKSNLEGFTVPRCKEILKAVLFADNTTVYLSRRDDFRTLQDVLDTWCSAAKARFNMSKTEIIPIGSEAHREEMATTYKTSGAWQNYPRGIHIAQDGEAVRILGAFFGNGADQVDIWTVILTKIVAMRKPLMHAISRWKAGHATVQGKKHVVQMIVGGMTQFFTTVQRMPDIILQRLKKIIREYLWDDRHNIPVGLEHVYLPVAKGGLGMLDLESRSEAIDIMWLKAYLDFSPERPIWAYVADNLFATHVPKDCRPRNVSLRLNPFLQRWKPKARGLPAELEAMMKVAKKHGVRLEGLAFSREMISSMPMWDHAQADRVRLNRLSVPSKLLTCLWDRHLARYVKDFVQLTSLLDRPDHRASVTCKCNGCTHQRSHVGCENPHLCAVRAREMINTLPGKWDPRRRLPEDYEKDNMARLLEEGLDEGLIPFDRCVTTYGHIGHAFRIFTEKSPVSDECIPMEIGEDGSIMTIATDGSCLRNGERNAQAGAGIYVADGHPLNRSLRLAADITQSNQSGEVMASLLAAMAAPVHARITLETDSQTTMDSITKWRPKHEDTGYILQTNAELLKATIGKLRMRRAHTLFRWIKGHNGHPGNEAADQLAAIAAAKPDGEQVKLDVPSPFRVTGAKLQSITQKLAYRAIRSKKDALIEPRPRAAANLDRVTCGARDVFGIELTEGTIWTSLRSRHVSRSASQFLWMAMHDGFMIGSHWSRRNMSVELQNRMYCSICGECESMTHILFECEARGQELIWLLLGQLWQLTKVEWKEPCWGTIFGAACAIFKTAQGGRKSAAESLWCILCTESVHLIWKLRCERVIQNEGAEFTAKEITHRFYSSLESRLNLDRRTAAMAKGKRALKPQEVERIWSPIIESYELLPPKWVTNCGVLVGIKRGR